MKTTDDRKSGSPRVASWLYEVINPLLESLPVEISFLEKGNSTWRFDNGRLEHLRKVSDYLTPEGRHVLRDFLKSVGDAQEPIDEHDALIENLCVAAAAAHASLMEREEFVSHARNTLEDFCRTEPTRPHPAGAFPGERFPELAAERVTNGIVDIPSYYTDAEFWQRYGKELLEFARGDKFTTLMKARERLVRSDQVFLEWLENKSFELCSMHDVPAAPLESLQ